MADEHYNLQTEFMTRNRIDHILRLLLPICLWWVGGMLVPVRAQQDAQFQQYWNTETVWSPASVGRTPQMEVNAAFHTHAMGYEKAGTSLFAGVNTAFQIGKTRHGVGALFYNDQLGFFNQMSVAAQYAYHTKLWGGTFSVGIEADLINDEIKGSKAELADGNDPAFPTTDLSGTAFDICAGLYYQRKALGVGISARNLVAPDITMGETNKFERKRQFNFTSSYNIKLKSPLYTITPSVMFRTDLADYRADVTCRIQYASEHRRLYGGVNYSPLHSAGLFFGGTLHGIDLCYSFEANTEGVGMIAGQHEVTLAYRLPLNLGKKGRNLHKSVRWL